MRLVKSFMFLCLGTCYCLMALAQEPAKTIKIAVFAPVYLDSAFADDGYKLGKNNLPRYILPGLDFYNGVMLAIDSLNTEKISAEVLFYDTKSRSASLEDILHQPEMQKVSMIIASFNQRTEIKQLADFAFEKKSTAHFGYLSQ